MLQYSVLLGVVAGLGIPLSIAVGTHLGSIWAGFQRLFVTIEIP
jgi:hypothetical protein